MKIATLDDISTILPMLKAMYMEVTPDLVVDITSRYEDLLHSHIKKDIVIFDDRGFFIMREETLPIHKYRSWNGVSVYVKPEYRHTKALKEYYDYMFKNFYGTIYGFTDAASKHNKVLMKRHKLLGYVYEINRS